MRHGRHYSLEEKQHILHRRWAICWIGLFIFIVVFHLWFFVEMFVGFWIMLRLLFWFIDWISGEDLNQNHARPHEPSSEERTMWDIYTLHEMNDHNDHFNDDGSH